MALVGFFNFWLFILQLLCLGGAPHPGPDWTCADERFDDGVCDCGCGEIDVDCADATPEACDTCDGAPSGGCNLFTTCPGTLDPGDNAVCLNPGQDWTCPLTWWADGVCDCGCGELDVLDCADGTVASCGSCAETSNGGCSLLAGCPGTVDPQDNAVCVNPTVAWTCPLTWWADGVCDCGCGEDDVLDCASEECTS